MLTPLQRVRLRTALNNNGYHNEGADFENWISATATLGPGTCWVTIDEDQADRFFVASSLSHVSNGLSGEQFKAVELAAKPPEVSRVFSAAGRNVHQENAAGTA